MKTRVEIVPGDHLKTLGNCGGFYSCPKGPDENRLGPVVGYSHRYDGKHQWVGDIYANFAKAEMHSNVLAHFSSLLAVELDVQIGLSGVDVFCGAPIGGYSLMTALELGTGTNAIKAEKKILELGVGGARDKSKLVFARHEVTPGERVVIVEDVCNNFSTTEELIALINSAGGIVVAIACFLNRSLMVERYYHSAAVNCEIPVVSLVRLPIIEWKQDNPAVAEDIAKGNVVLDPKKGWDRLMKAMHGK